MVLSARYVGPGLLPNKMKLCLHSTAQQHHERCWLWLSLQDVQRTNHMRCLIYEALHGDLDGTKHRCSLLENVPEGLRSKNLRCSTTRNFRKYSGDQTASLGVLNRPPTRISSIHYLTDVTSRAEAQSQTLQPSHCQTRGSCTRNVVWIIIGDENHTLTGQIWMYCTSYKL
jgi:hypothetical protein